MSRRSPRIPLIQTLTAHVFIKISFRKGTGTKADFSKESAAPAPIPFSINFSKELLLCNILSDVQSNRYYDNDSLCNILIVGVNTQILQTGLQDFKYQYSD